MRSWRYALPASIILFLGYLIMLQPKWILNRLMARSPEVLYAVGTEEKLIALTIDDGPDPIYTSQILDELAQYDAHATFFLLSDRINGNEALVERLVEEGHELGNHLKEDTPSILHADVEFEERLQTAHETLSQYGEVRWFRPGSGWYNQAMISSLEKYQYRLVLGSIYPFDSHIPSSWFASRYIVWRADPGDVIILHDYGARGKRTVETLNYCLPRLKERGYTIVTLGELYTAGQSASSSTEANATPGG
jgi:peptidoglycan/xylan/chitin deacetylase (PgdA/CDA1 family)